MSEPGILHVSNVVLADPADAVGNVALHLGVDRGRILSSVLVKRSLDARHHPPRWIGAFQVRVAAGLALTAPGCRPWTERDDGRYALVEPFQVPRLTSAVVPRPVVIGAGPAGLYAALYLAEAGANPLLLERGGPVKERVGVVNGFWRRKVALDPENNVVFGEGGAGTFSDGKIYTRRRDGDLGYIFRRLIDFGAEPADLKEAWAHLGTDRIRALLPAFRTRLEQLGCEIRFHCRVDSLLAEGGRCVGVRVDGEDVIASGVFAAVGHSARDSLRMMVDAGAEAVARPIAVGVRIEHPQALVDRARYRAEDRGTLPPATYRLTSPDAAGRKVHSFCMCPGGMVVAATNQAENVVVNGMSFSARRARWANSALIVEVEPRDYPTQASGSALAGFAFQDQIERACFEAGGRDQTAPGQRVADFLSGRVSRDLPSSSYPLGLRSVDLAAVLPPFVCASLRAALGGFERTIPGFSGESGVMIAPETRTTSPIRFLRNEGLESVSLPGLYPVGEGAGYGGGIISSALDGLRAARVWVASRPCG